jgi:hypothetical protein
MCGSPPGIRTAVHGYRESILFLLLATGVRQKDLHIAEPLKVFARTERAFATIRDRLGLPSIL